MPMHETSFSSGVTLAFLAYFYLSNSSWIFSLQHRWLLWNPFLCTSITLGLGPASDQWISLERTWMSVHLTQIGRSMVPDICEHLLHWSLHMLGNGNFLDRILNHAFASPPCHKRSFSLPAIYLPTYPFRLWITKITVTKILCWDVYQDVSFILCLAMLNVRSACALISLLKIPLT
jgi:hypothetical protein